MGEEWDSLESRIKQALKETEEELGKGEERRKGWWDEECVREKKRVRKELRDWRRKGGEGERYKREKREYGKLCERKKEEENRRWERRAEEARRESEVWEIVNRERRRRKRVNEGIGMLDWKEHFMRILGGVEGRVVRGGERSGQGEGKEEEEIDREEIRRALRTIRDGKAAGIDEIPAEVWKYGGEELEEWVWGFCNRVWKGEGWPENWKEGVIVPIMKKGEGEKVEEYRGVTMMPTLYKVYVTVLPETSGSITQIQPRTDDVTLSV
ncbi:uncharacterized protein [Linepithema humile]|uniref:uncharacterized protein n=1 Tax=Linepithema humile TaxID=83485 RepID=UPI00351DADE4